MHLSLLFYQLKYQTFILHAFISILGIFVKFSPYVKFMSENTLCYDGRFDIIVFLLERYTGQTMMRWSDSESKFS